MSMTRASTSPVQDTPVPRRPEEAKALLRDCFAQFASGLLNTVRVSIDTTDDLFEVNEYVTPEDVRNFRNKREAWVERFDKAVHELFERRVIGTRRKGRRPDVDASVNSLRVLNEFDYDKQIALTRATGKLMRLSRTELKALDGRVAALFNESATRDFDNPFSPDYILDAIGMTSREIYPSPRIWRSLMERVLDDVSPFVTKIYVTLNRFLADQQVLPEIKAELRAKSDLRPSDDAELFTLFGQLFKEAGSPGENAPDALPNVEVPAAFAPEPGKRPLDISGESAARPTPPSVPFSPYGTPRPGGQPMFTPSPMPMQATSTTSATSSDVGHTASPTTSLHPGVAEGQRGYGVAVPPGFAMLVPIGGQGAPIAVPSGLVTGAGPAYGSTLRAGIASSSSAGAADDGFSFPQLDPMMTLGSSSAIFATLEQWQHYDPSGDILRAAVASGDVPSEGSGSPAIDATAAPPPLPLNRIPYIRAAIADKISSPTEKITMDVIGLLFDYIFRDPSIPESLRELFGKLQVPILKAALLDRGFFSDKRHPARRLLDRLAAAAIAATSDETYRMAFESVARSVVDEICADYKIDIAAFQGADAKVQTFIESEQGRVAQGLSGEVADALAAEERETDRAHVHIVLRDRLARLDVPAPVREFVESVWADYMTSIRASDGEDSAPWQAAAATLDDLLWSITAKERTAQKARLTKLIPKLVGNLRKGCTAASLSPERAKAFFENLYELHMTAIKAKPQASAVPVDTASGPRAPVDAGSAPESTSPSGPLEEPTVQPQSSVGDFVSEMAVGTWIAFQRAGEVVNARLFWISPLRTKYIFTTRTRGRALVVTPDQLAREIEVGTASLVVEPVPLFDRAVSAALDSLAARKAPANDAAAPLGNAA